MALNCSLFPPRASKTQEARSVWQMSVCDISIATKSFYMNKNNSYNTKKNKRMHTLVPSPCSLYPPLLPTRCQQHLVWVSASPHFSTAPVPINLSLSDSIPEKRLDKYHIFWQPLFSFHFHVVQYKQINRKGQHTVIIILINCYSDASPQPNVENSRFES